MLAAYPKTTRPLTALHRRASITQVFAVLAAAGVGTLATVGEAKGIMSTAMAGVGGFSPVLTAPSFASTAMAGTGTFTGVLTATAGSAASMVGDSSFGAFDTHDRAVTFQGNSSFSAIGYAFFLDGERACVHQEPRTATVATENKTAIVPFEDRVYRVAWEPRTGGNQPRKRIC